MDPKRALKTHTALFKTRRAYHVLGYWREKAVQRRWSPLFKAGWKFHVLQFSAVQRNQLLLEILIEHLQTYM